MASEVILYTVEGGGHTWPGRDPRLPLLGKSTRDISANDLIWDFFQKHPMRDESEAHRPGPVAWKVPYSRCFGAVPIDGTPAVGISSTSLSAIRF